jgi:hypothetical protein
VVPTTWEAEIGGSQFNASLYKDSTGLSRTTKNQKSPKRKSHTGGVAPVLEHLPNKYEAMSSIPSPNKEKSKAL